MPILILYYLFIQLDDYGRVGLPSQISPMTPLFSLDRALSQRSYAASGLIEGFQSQQYGTQSRDVQSRRAGYLRGTQQRFWTQTQPGGGSTPSGDGGGWIAILATQKLLGEETRGGPVGGTAMPPPVGLPSYAKKHLIRQNTQHRGGGAYGDQKALGYSSLQYGDTVVKKRGNGVNKTVLYRKYREGELPDICIPLGDVLGPIQGLCLYDPVFAAVIYETIFDHFYATFGSKDVSWSFQLRKILSGILCECQSVGGNNQFVNSMLNCCLSCLSQEQVPSGPSTAPFSSTAPDSITNISPEMVGDVALDHLCIHIGIQFLEEKILKLVQVKSLKFHEALRLDDCIERTWLQLSRLYSGLSEYDVLLGLCTRLRAYGATKTALDAEISGDYERAVECYNSIIRDADDVDHAGQPELTVWDERSLECLKNLLDWKQLDEKVDILAGTVENLYEPKLRGRLLGLHVKCITNLDDREESLDRFLRMVQDGDSELRDWVESRLTLDLATSHGLRKDWPKAGYFVEKCYEQFLMKWTALHPCAAAARLDLLQHLQRLVELEDVVEHYSINYSDNGVRPFGASGDLISR